MISLANIPKATASQSIFTPVPDESNLTHSSCRFRSQLPLRVSSGFSPDSLLAQQALLRFHAYFKQV